MLCVVHLLITAKSFHMEFNMTHDSLVQQVKFHILCVGSTMARSSNSELVPARSVDRYCSSRCELRLEILQNLKDAIA